MTENIFDEALPKVMQTIRGASALAAQDVNFYKSIDASLSLELDNSAQSLFDLTKRLMQVAGEEQEVFQFGKENISSDSSWKPVANVLDSIFEKIDTAIDKLVKKKPSNALTYLDDGSNSAQQSRKIAKPQVNFKVKVDNSELSPFKPKLTSKPHSLKSFKDTIQLITPVQDATAEDGTMVDPPFYPQPYEQEIDSQPYNESILKKSEPIPSKDWKTTSAIWVDTPEKVRAMVDDLKSSKEIAVDLEHHDYRTFYGIVCLMQISNREQDWIVDTLILRDDLQPLNEVFTNPQIVKVFHGAFMDIIWLQRDLGLYIVSLFDTYHASKALGFPKLSLAYLLETFATFKTSKKYQLADWRIRPLDNAMMSYARSDTHFLLNIYDTLRNKLVEAEKMQQVLHDSRQVAKRRFEYTKFRPLNKYKNVVCPIMGSNPSEPYQSLISQYNIPLQQKPLVEALYVWRDSVARKEDESVRYVMSNQLLVSLSNLQSPIDSTKVLSCSTYITDHVRLHAKDLAVMLDAASISIQDKQQENTVDTVDEFNQNDISSVASYFSQLCEDKIELLESKSDLLGTTSSLFKTVLSKEQNTYEYDVESQTVKKHDFAKEFAKRLQSSLNKLQEYELLEQEKIQEQNKQLEEQSDEEDEEVEEVQESQPIRGAPVRPSVLDRTLDPTEVVSIRKKSFQPRKKAVEAEESTESFVDYANADKIMLDNKNKKRNQANQKKKRSFDPYSKESEGPQPAKRAKMINMGKSSTFTKTRRS